jgi:hypothetical protein
VLKYSPSFVALVLLVGCGSSFKDPAQSVHHPANPEASQAKLDKPSDTLAPSSDVMSASTASPASDHKHDSSGMHDMGMMQPSGGMGHDMAGMAGMHMQHDSAAPAASAPATTQTAELYTCSMHPEVVSKTPGKCPKCGMKLVKKEDKK